MASLSVPSRRLGLILFLLACVAPPPATAASSRTERAAVQSVPHRLVFRVDAGASRRVDVPVGVLIEGLDLRPDEPMHLEEILDDGQRQPVPSQIEGGVSARLWWILEGETPAGSRRTFELVPGPGPSASRVTAERDDKVVRLAQAGRPVLDYHWAIDPAPEGADIRFARSAFIHPLFSPSGATLTRIRPPDHLHHMGLWNPWTHTRFEGHEVDFWNLGKGQGTVRFVRFLSLTEGPVYGGFRVLQEHVDLTGPGGGKPALEEVWDVRVWAAGGKAAGAWTVDLTSTLACAGPSPLELLAYRYGGLGFRARASWSAGDYLTSEGRHRQDGHGTRARWCDVFGPIDEKTEGVLFMSHPFNHEHPEPMRIWDHTQEIFFNFCPVQKAAWRLMPGKEYTLRYRLWVHTGALDAAEAERRWQDFAHPPRVQVESTGQAAGEVDGR